MEAPATDDLVDEWTIELPDPAALDAADTVRSPGRLGLLEVNFPALVVLDTCERVPQGVVATVSQLRSVMAMSLIRPWTASILPCPSASEASYSGTNHFLRESSRIGT